MRFVTIGAGNLRTRRIWPIAPYNRNKFELNLMHTIRRRRTRTVSSVLGAFVLVWASMMLQPCLMAMDLSPVDHCPHCPQQDIQPPCHESESACTFIDSIDYDGRTASVDLNELLPALAVVIDRLPDAALLVPPDTPGSQRHPTRWPDRPPFNILHCVFLI